MQRDQNKVQCQCQVYLIGGREGDNGTVIQWFVRVSTWEHGVQKAGMCQCPPEANFGKPEREVLPP
jgi:hypothetical protein